MGMYAGDDLLHAGDDLFRRHVLFGKPCGGGMANVVDPLHQHDPPQSRGREHVAIQPRQSAGAEEVLRMIMQDAIAADASVYDADGRRPRPGRQTFRQPVGPAVVGVNLRTVAVGDRVPESDYGPWLTSRLDVHLVDEEP